MRGEQTTPILSRPDEVFSDVARTFELRHWHDFSDIAVVTDHDWLRIMVGVFKPFFRGDVRLFSLDELPTARSWITDSKRVG